MSTVCTEARILVRLTKNWIGLREPAMVAQRIQSHAFEENTFVTAAAAQQQAAVGEVLSVSLCYQQTLL